MWTTILWWYDNSECGKVLVPAPFTTSKTELYTQRKKPYTPLVSRGAIQLKT